MKKKLTSFCLVIAAVVLSVGAPGAEASSGYYTTNCVSCHGATPTTCNGCHGHGIHSSSAKSNINLTGTTNKTTYSPGEAVSITISGGYRTGWVRAILYDQNMNELARSTGPTGEGGGASFPITVTAPAPATPGTYTWNASWYGNRYDRSSSPVFGPRWTPDPNNPNHGEEIVSTNSFTVTGTIATPHKVGVFSSGAWYLDSNSNGTWNSVPTDALRWFGGGIPGTVPATGDWTGGGTTKIGVFMNGSWYLDLDANGAWDGTPTDSFIVDFGGKLAGAVPVTGDWTDTGMTKIGVYQNGTWYLDLNGNGTWDSAPADGLYYFGDGLTGAVPVTGDWNGTGTTKIGVYANGVWYLDLNGNGIWNGTPTDGLYYFGDGLTGAAPVTGDWTGTGTTKIGIYQNGTWYLDLTDNRVWNGTPTDGLYYFGGGVPGAIPVTGIW